jgi:hypothetical protein
VVESRPPDGNAAIHLPPIEIFPGAVSRHLKLILGPRNSPQKTFPSNTASNLQEWIPFGSGKGLVFGKLYC